MPEITQEQLDRILALAEAGAEANAIQPPSMLTQAFKALGNWIVANIPAPLVKVTAVFLFLWVLFQVPPFSTGAASFINACNQVADHAEAKAEQTRLEIQKLQGP